MVVRVITEMSEVMGYLMWIYCIMYVSQWNTSIIQWYTMYVYIFIKNTKFTRVLKHLTIWNVHIVLVTKWSYYVCFVDNDGYWCCVDVNTSWMTVYDCHVCHWIYQVYGYYGYYYNQVPSDDIWVYNDDNRCDINWDECIHSVHTSYIPLYTWIYPTCVILTYPNNPHWNVLPQWYR